MKYGDWWSWVPKEVTQPAVVFDIETNAIDERGADSVHTVHSLVIKDVPTGTVLSYSDVGIGHGYAPIKEGLAELANAPVLVGHNIISFDLPALRKVYPSWRPEGKVLDTLNCSRLIWPDLKDKDFRFAFKNKWFPKKMIGRHSLESWGYRIGERKDTFGKTSDWSNWSPEMQTYCEQDVEVNLELYKLILRKGYSRVSLALEMFFQEAIAQQERFGFPFYVRDAQKLYVELASRRSEILEELQQVFPPKYKAKAEFTPKADHKKHCYRAGCPMTKIELTPFNPNSRMQIVERLNAKYGWSPADDSVSDDVLEKLEYPEAKLLAEVLLVEKRIGQLAEGKNAWLKLERDGRIHGRVITNGAVTGRCTHRTPNMAQVPTIDVPYGKQCRSLFGAPEGWVQVGADASGLELRNLGHYMARFDGGEYIKVILEGDIHWVNAQALGLVPDGTVRDDHNDKHLWARNKVAKRFIYAFLYGAGDELLGSLLEPDADADRKKKLGRKLRNSFLKKIPALKRVIDGVQEKAKEKGYLKGLDGRLLHVRSLHSALNTLLQSAGAILMKAATVFLCWDLTKRGYVFGVDYAQVAHVHDEYQLVCRPEIAAEVGECAVQAIRDAGEFFKFRCPLDGEYKTGSTWADCH